MSNQITVSATEARRNFFKLFEEVSKTNKKVVITKKGLSDAVVLKKEEPKAAITRKKEIERNRRIVNETYGALKSKVPYNPKEMELAAEIFVKEYAKKNGFK